MCKLLIRRKKKEKIVQIINIRVDGGCKKIQEKQEGLYKIFTHNGAADSLENIYTPFLWSRGCCTKYSHTIEQRML
jgi:hypothetical protein